MDDSEIYFGHYHKNQREGLGVLKNSEYLVAGQFSAGEFKVPENSNSSNNKLEPRASGRGGFAPSLTPKTLRKGFKL